MAIELIRRLFRGKAREAGNGKRLLIATEDNAEAEILSIYARQLGYQSVVCNDVAAVVQHLRKDRYKGMLMDLHLGGRNNGFRLLRELRNDAKLKALPVAFVAEKARRGDSQRIRNHVKGTAILRRPFSPATIRKALYKAAHNGESEVGREPARKPVGV